MNLKALENYFIEHKKVTIPEAQRSFEVSYAEARQAFKQLQENKKITLSEGVEFEWCGADDDEEDLLTEEDLPEFLELLEEMCDDVGDDQDSSEQINPYPEGNEQVADAITQNLAALGIRIKLAKVVNGATVTQYVFDVLSDTPMSAFNKYECDVLARVVSRMPVRIVAPLAGTSQIAVEVVNDEKSVVTTASVINSLDFIKSKGQLDFAVGEDVARNKVVVDLAKLPHLLISGTAGSGKTILLHDIIVSLARKYSPEYLRFVMVDTKFMELSIFNGLPHMLTRESVTNTTDAIAALEYLIGEMEARYVTFRASAVGNIVEYNKKATQKLPYLVLVVDEYSDIISQCKADFEYKLMLLAQKCRAAGIHIVLATQRPDVKTVTGTIKAVMPARMTMRLASAVDSNMIINRSGGEKLGGGGDMLFCSPFSSELQRIQCGYISNDDVRQTIERLKSVHQCNYDDVIEQQIFRSKAQPYQQIEAVRASLDPLCKDALRFWLEKQSGRASIASIQRNLGIGFNRAGRIVDSLQKLGLVSTSAPNDSSVVPLRVLVQLDELDKLFPD